MELETSFTRDLKAPLTDEEQHERSLILARTLEEIADVEAEKAKNARQYGEKLKGLKLRSITLAHAVSSKEEDRPVLCSERADMRRFQILTYRHDNGEVVDTRAMNADELEEARQTSLFPGVRVGTGEKKPKGGLDLATPAAAETSKTESDAQPFHGEPTVADAEDGATITDPGGVLDGKGATGDAGKTQRRRAKRGGGLHIVDGEPAASKVADPKTGIVHGDPPPESA